MIPLPVIFELFDYTYWAPDRQLQACLELTKRQFTQPMGGSFSSLRDTMAHLATVEWLWLERWHSEPGPVSWNRALSMYAWRGRHHAPHVTSMRQRKGW